MVIPVQVQRMAVQAQGDRAGDGDVVAGGDCFVAQVVVAAAAKVTTIDFPSQLRPTAVLTVILFSVPVPVSVLTLYGSVSEDRV